MILRTRTYQVRSASKELSQTVSMARKMLHITWKKGEHASKKVNRTSTPNYSVDPSCWEQYRQRMLHHPTRAFYPVNLGLLKLYFVIEHKMMISMGKYKVKWEIGGKWIGIGKILFHLELIRMERFDGNIDSMKRAPNTIEHMERFKRFYSQYV